MKEKLRLCPLHARVDSRLSSNQTKLPCTQALLNRGKDLLKRAITFAYATGLHLPFEPLLPMVGETTIHRGFSPRCTFWFVILMLYTDHLWIIPHSLKVFVVLYVHQLGGGGVDTRWRFMTINLFSVISTCFWKRRQDKNRTSALLDIS